MIEVACDRLLSNGKEPDMDVGAIGARRHFPQQLGLAETATSDDHRDLGSFGVTDPRHDFLYQLGPADEGLPMVEEGVRRAAVILLGRPPRAGWLEAQESLHVVGKVGTNDLMSSLGVEAPYQPGQVREIP